MFFVTHVMEHFYPRESRIPEIGMGSYHVILNSKKIPCCSTIPAMYVEEKKKPGFLPVQIFLLPVQRCPHRLITG